MRGRANYKDEVSFLTPSSRYSGSRPVATDQETFEVEGTPGLVMFYTDTPFVDRQTPAFATNVLGSMSQYTARTVGSSLLTAGDTMPDRQVGAIYMTKPARYEPKGETYKGGAEVSDKDLGGPLFGEPARFTGTNPAIFTGTKLYGLAVRAHRPCLPDEYLRLDIGSKAFGWVFERIKQSRMRCRRDAYEFARALASEVRDGCGGGVLFAEAGPTEFPVPAPRVAGKPARYRVDLWSNPPGAITIELAFRGDPSEPSKPLEFKREPGTALVSATFDQHLGPAFGPVLRAFAIDGRRVSYVLSLTELE